MKHTIGILAHVDAGKTTLSERLLFSTDAIRDFGRVDDGKSHLDYSDIERERGITVFSDVARFSAYGHEFTLLDTPGHADFSAETERAVSAMDYAILVISAIDGVQSHTETVWRILSRYKVPTFVFINKTDAATADKEKTLGEIKSRLSPSVCDFETEFFEAVAETDEALLEEYIETGKLNISDAVFKAFENRRVFPCFSGSALRGEGIDEFIKNMASLCREKETDGELSAVCYKVRRADNLRFCYLKINSGRICPKDIIKTPLGDMKADEIRMPFGEKLVSAKSAEKGDICAVAGLAGVRTGDVLGKGASHGELFTEPVFSARVIPCDGTPMREIYEKLKIMEDEDSTLSVRYTEALGETDISVMGKISLQVTAYEFMRRFGKEIDFGTCRVLYRETVSEPACGYGHFEPLRHYAEVHIRLDPAPRGSGISFKSECSTDVLKKDVQNLIRTHVFEKKHKGVLCGAELCDVTCVLINGRVHEKHTEGGDLREATYRAIRQGLMKAKNVLLEPIYSFTARSDAAVSGKIMSDVRRMGGSFEPPQEENGVFITCGKAPARFLSDYAEELTAKSGGKASIALSFCGYEPCRDAEEIVAETGYEPCRDVENTPDSVFCAHGAGFPVKWDEAESYMNCL